MEVGNLTADGRFSHYELQSLPSSVLSALGKVYNFGSMTASGTYTSFSVPLDNRYCPLNLFLLDQTLFIRLSIFLSPSTGRLAFSALISSYPM